MPAPGPRSRGARVHPRPCPGCKPWPRSSAASGLVLATQELGGITGRGTSVAITILEGSSFCISDQNGDFTFTTSGLYAFDTRFLSHLELRINGERPLLLSAGKAEYYSAAFFLRN